MQTAKPLRDKKIILGVTGCIAAYKSAELLRALKKLGADVWVIMTRSAREFVAPLTFRTLSGNPCITEMYDSSAAATPVPHISISDSADLLLVAPATANIIGKTAGGIADDMLSTTIMACRAPKIFAPAMNTNMWGNPLVRENVKKLKGLGYCFIGPASGELACGTEGEGRLACIEDIVAAVEAKIGIKQDLAGKKVLITAGGTREAIDPVRFIGNRSSGKMGLALARQALDRGAEVRVVLADARIDFPKEAALEKVSSALEMKKTVLKHFDWADIVIMAAAISDFKPAVEAKDKIKKGTGDRIPDTEAAIKLERTDDILQELGKKKGSKTLIGFSVESKDLIKNSKRKLKEKNLDLIVANPVEAFESDESEAVLMSSGGRSVKLKKQDKAKLAASILDSVL